MWSLLFTTVVAHAASPALQWTPASSFAATQVSVGYHTACARTRPGGVVCWGERLGVHDGGAAWTLADVNDVEQVIVTGWQLVIRHTDGRVSQRGLGDVAREGTLAGIAAATSLARTDGGACAVHSAGQVSCWGHAPWLKQRDDPTWTAATVPKLSGVASLACDDWGCCAVGTQGVSCAGQQGPEGMPTGDTFRKWTTPTMPKSGRLLRGYDRACWLGEGCVGEPYVDSGFPFAELAGADDLALHYSQACVTKGDATRCRSRQGTVTLPALVQVDLGAQTSCGVDAAGGVWCWGANEGNVLGDGSPSWDPTPAKVAESAELLAAVHWSTCIVQESSWHCAGDASSAFRSVGPAFGGVGSSQYQIIGVDGGSLREIRLWKDEAETEYIPGPAGAIQVAASDRASNRFAGGSSGLHAAYSLGEGGSVGWVPMGLPPDFGTVVGLATPAVGVCALSEGGQVACWRDERFDQDDDFVDAPTRKQRLRLVDGIEGAVEISCGQDILCARQADGRVLCTGSIAMGGGALRAPAVELSGLRGATDLASTNFHLCAVVDGAVRCVGSNGWGQLGRPRQGGEFDSGSSEPVTVPLPVRAVQVAAGQEHSCARGEDGSVWCWGADTQGQLGRGRPIELVDRAVQVQGSGAGRSKKRRRPSQ